MGSCCDSGSDWICPLLCVNLDFAIGNPLPTDRASSMLQLFHQLFVTYKHSYLISVFDSSVLRTLFHYSIVLCLYTVTHCSYLTLFCFLNSGFFTAILPYRSASGFSSQLMWAPFLRHWFSYVAMFGTVTLLSHKLVTLMKLSSALIVGFGHLTVVLGIFIFCTNEVKCLQINFSKDILLY